MQWKIKSVHSWQFGSCLFHWWVIYSPILIQNFSFCCINSLKIQNLLFLLEWFWLHLLISKFKYAECCLYLVGIENYFPICWKRRKYSYDTHAWIWHYWNGLFSVLFSKKCTDNMCIFYSPFYSHLAGLIRPLQKTKSSKRVKEDDKNLLTARLLMTIRKKLKNSRIIMINVINILVWWLITMVTMVKKLWCEILILMNKILPIKRRGIMVTFSWEL